ncbi:aldolase [Corynebacterium suranareeae]|uniref:Aldolase n=1 Tax=Corynebacterium suranareeae TaxID=2506452 RepID=A0A169RNL5_9CORY|nr:aldolase/citrate lyase family protein [Corynebacterium suranareeae]BAU94598.1 aldolase [Corynebacterium suranareeae]
MPEYTTPRFGAWITLNSTVASEQIARLGFDFVVVDGQHGLIGYTEMRDSLIALTAGGCPLPIARVSTNDPGEIGRVLDAGARGVIVPMVNTAQEAAELAKAARYATSGGQRSYSPVRHGIHFGLTPGQTDDVVLVLAMIETREGLENVEAILDTPGIDGVFVGPYDLSLGLGASIPFEEAVRPELEEALTTIRNAAVSRSKIAGIYCGTGDDAIVRAQQGFNLINTCHDMSALREVMGAQLSVVSEAGLCTAGRLEEELRAH